MKVYPGEKYLAIIFFAFSLLVMYFSYKISGFKSMSSPGSFPMFVSFILFISSIFVLIEVKIKQTKYRQEVIGNRDIPTDSSNSLSVNISTISYLFPRLFLTFFLATLAYVFIIVRLSFIPASILFLVFTIIYFKSEKFKLDTRETIKTIIVSIIIVYVVYFIFHSIFKVILP